MQQHVVIAGDKVAEMPKKLFTTIVKVILFQNSCDNLFVSITILFYFHTTNIAISNAFLMSKFFQDIAFLGTLKIADAPKLN